LLYIPVNEELGEVLCTYYDEEDCRFAYVYTYSDNNTLMVRAQEERDCPPGIYVLGMYLSSHLSCFKTVAFHLALVKVSADSYLQQTIVAAMTDTEFKNL